MKIRYVTGDATKPQGDGVRVIAHCCNDLGIWGAGFVLALSKAFPKAEEAYREWDASYRDRHETLPLGGVQCVTIESDLFVANIVGQRGIGWSKAGPAIRYEAIQEGLSRLREMLKGTPGATVHMPRMGAGLAGGDWDRIEKIVQKELCDHGIEVTVYDLPKRTG